MNSKQVNDATNRLLSFMGDIKDGNLRTLLANMQTMCEYQAEKLRIYEEHFTELTGKERPELSDSDKRRLAQRGKTLNDYLLATVEPTWCVGTIRGWYNSLVGAKYDSTAPGQRKRGRKPISPEIVEKILYLQKRNPDWGYDRIAGTMRYLGYDVSATTIRKVLDDHGIVPDPERRKRGDWQQFIETQQYVAAATDFATVEVLTEHGLVREHLLFFMDVGSRKVRLGGIAHNPDSNWTTQIARNLSDAWDGFLLGQKYLIHDRDTLFTEQFDAILASIDVKSKKLPPRSPELNGHIESFIKTFKTECLGQLVLTSEAQLRYVVHHFLEYYNHERPHMGLGGKMIKPHPQEPDGEIMEFSRLGGLLKSYRRVKRAVNE